MKPNRAKFVGRREPLVNLERTFAAKPGKDPSKQPEHKTAEACWCNPELIHIDPDTGVSIWCHGWVH